MGFFLLRFIHILSVVTWLGFFIVIVVINVFVKREKDIGSLKKLYYYEIKAGNVLIAPAAIIALISGVMLTEIFGFGWPFLATWGGIIVIVVMILGGAVVQKLRKHLIKMIESLEDQFNTIPQNTKTIKTHLINVNDLINHCRLVDGF